MTQKKISTDITLFKMKYKNENKEELNKKIPTK
jgi:hypothetical protein